MDRKNSLDHPTFRPIGFDIRRAADLDDPQWDGGRKSQFLIRTDIQRPLSVDQQVWRSEFPEPEDSEWRGVLGHWSNLAVMCKTAHARGLRGSLVASAVVWDALSAQEQLAWSSDRLEETVPAVLGPEWRLLGYDVADTWLLSGLSNCGYVGTERAEWRATWMDRINDLHLLRDLTEARRFAEATDRRVPEHAPFFVYALLTSSMCPTARE